MQALRAKLDEEQSASRKSQEEVKALAVEIEMRKRDLYNKEEELQELQEEKEEFETTTFNPTYTQLSRLKVEQQQAEEAIRRLLSKVPEGTVQMKGLGELDQERMTSWGVPMFDEAEGEITTLSLQDALVSDQLPIRVDGRVDPPVYVWEESADLVKRIRARFPGENGEKILRHILEAHTEYVGTSSAGTIVRVPWDFERGAQMPWAQVVDAITDTLFP